MAVVVSGSGSPSPSARACSDLKADVASYVNAPNSSRALAKAEDCIRAAVGKLNLRLWNWSIIYQDITLVASQIDYDLAAPFKAPRQGNLLDSNSYIVGQIGFKDMKTMSLEHDDTRTIGSPVCYTVYNAHEYGTMSFDIAPDTSYIAKFPTLRLWYYRRIEPCGGSTTALDVPFEVAEWVAWYAKALMAAHHDPQKFGIADQTQRDLWRDLIRDKMVSELSDWS